MKLFNNESFMFTKLSSQLCFMLLSTCFQHNGIILQHCNVKTSQMTVTNALNQNLNFLNPIKTRYEIKNICNAKLSTMQIQIPFIIGGVSIRNLH